MGDDGFDDEDNQVKVIRGIGIDMIEIARMRGACNRWGEKFLERLFTKEEIGYAFSKHNPYLPLAARFAAKEAGFKALSQAGIHISRWNEMEVCRSAEGQPTLELANISGVAIHLSISHTREMAIAIVIAEVENEA